MATLDSCQSLPPSRNPPWKRWWTPSANWSRMPENKCSRRSSAGPRKDSTSSSIRLKPALLAAVGVKLHNPGFQFVLSYIWFEFLHSARNSSSVPYSTAKASFSRVLSFGAQLLRQFDLLALASICGPYICHPGRLKSSTLRSKMLWRQRCFEHSFVSIPGRFRPLAAAGLPANVAEEGLSPDDSGVSLRERDGICIRVIFVGGLNRHAVTFFVPQQNHPADPILLENPHDRRVCGDSSVGDERDGRSLNPRHRSFEQFVSHFSRPSKRHILGDTCGLSNLLLRHL